MEPSPSAVDPSSCKCPICHELFSQPRLLPCAHLVCHDCLSLGLQADDRSFKCPLCQTGLFEGREDTGQAGYHHSLLDDFPVDESMSLTVKWQQALQNSTCGNCPEKSDGEWLCYHCNILLCKKCYSAHGTMKALQHHTTAPLHQITVQDFAKNSPIFCQDHEDKIAELYCQTHLKTVCPSCAFSTHRACQDVKKIDEKVLESKAVLTELVEKLNGAGTSLTEAVQELNKEAEQIQKDSESAQAEIDARCDGLQKTVEDTRTRLKNRVQKNCSRLTSERAQDKTVLKRRLGVVNSSMEAVRRTVEVFPRTAPDSAASGLLRNFQRLDLRDTLTGTTSNDTTATPEGDEEIRVKVEMDQYLLNRIARDLKILGDHNVAETGELAPVPSSASPEPTECGCLPSTSPWTHSSTSSHKPATVNSQSFPDGPNNNLQCGNSSTTTVTTTATTTTSSLSPNPDTDNHNARLQFALDPWERNDIGHNMSVVGPESQTSDSHAYRSSADEQRSPSDVVDSSSPTNGSPVSARNCFSAFSKSSASFQYSPYVMVEPSECSPNSAVVIKCSMSSKCPAGFAVVSSSASGVSCPRVAASDTPSVGLSAADSASGPSVFTGLSAFPSSVYGQSSTSPSATRRIGMLTPSPADNLEPSEEANFRADSVMPTRPVSPCLIGWINSLPTRPLPSPVRTTSWTSVRTGRQFQFHGNSGYQIKLRGDMTTAFFRGNARGGGIVLTRDPMKPDTLYEVQVDKTTDIIKGSLTVGVVQTDNAALLQIPAGSATWRSAISISPTSVSLGGQQMNWDLGKALGELNAGSRAGVLLDSRAGNLHLFVNAKDRSVTAETLALRSPCHAFFQLKFFKGCTQISSREVRRLQAKI